MAHAPLLSTNHLSLCAHPAPRYHACSSTALFHCREPIHNVSVVLGSVDATARLESGDSNVVGMVGERVIADGGVVVTITCKGFNRLKLACLQYSNVNARSVQKCVYMFPEHDLHEQSQEPVLVPAPAPSLRVTVSVSWRSTDADLLHLHARDSCGEEVFRARPSCDDTSMVIALPSDQGDIPGGLDTLTINARSGVSYVVWAFAYTEQDVFETGAIASVSVENGETLHTSDLHAPRTYIQGAARWWEILRITPNGAVHCKNSIDIEPPLVYG